MNAVSALIGTVLRHPMVMRVKMPIKTAYWEVRGRLLPAPRLPRDFDSILFVCKGNICRSPFAEVLTTKLLHESNRDHVRCASAGLAVKTQGGMVPPFAMQVATRYGVSLAGHRPTQLTEELVKSFAVIVAMEAYQMAELQRRFPAYRDRFVLLAMLVPESHRARAGFERYNIFDPYGHAEAAFARCYELIDVTLRHLLLREKTAKAG